MTTGKGFLISPGQGLSTQRHFLGSPLRLLATRDATGGAYTLLEREELYGFATPWHVHNVDDEAFFVLDGEVVVVYDGQRWEAGPGSFVFLPRAEPHAFGVSSDKARLLQVTNPSGFEDFAAEVADVPLRLENAERVKQAAARAGIDILGPSPFGPA